MTPIHIQGLVHAVLGLVKVELFRVGGLGPHVGRVKKSTS